MIVGTTNTTVLEIVDAPAGSPRCVCIDLQRATAQKLVGKERPFYFRITSSYCPRCEQFPFLSEAVVRAYGVAYKLSTLDDIPSTMVRMVREELWPKAKMI